MTWNNRIIRHVDNGQEWYAIHEVYYTEDEPGSVTVEPVAPTGEDLEDLRKGYEMMAEAFKAPVLDYSLFEEKERKGREAEEAERVEVVQSRGVIWTDPPGFHFDPEYFDDEGEGEGESQG